MFVARKKQVHSQQVLKILALAVKQQQSILYMGSNQTALITVTLSLQNRLYIRSTSRQLSQQISVKIDNFSETDLSSISFVFFQAGDAFIVYKRPFKIFYLTKFEDNCIPLILPKQVEFQKCSIELSYPNLIIFGARSDYQPFQVIEFNFETIQFKTIQDGRAYSPTPRKNHLSLIADGRVYVFGGLDKKGKDCEKMVWVYDIQKGYWFALDMDYPSEIDFSRAQYILLTNTKVLIMEKSQKRSWVFEIHQSKLSSVRDLQDYQGSSQSQNLSFQGQIINYSRKQWSISNYQIIYVKFSQ